MVWWYTSKTEKILLTQHFMPEMASQSTPENDAISLTLTWIPSSVKWKGLSRAIGDEISHLKSQIAF